MAVIGKIRNKMGWLLIIFIGFAMLAFILGDLMGNGNQGQKLESSVGSINGTEVSVTEFEEAVNAQVNQYAQQGQPITDALKARVRSQVWEQTLNRKALQAEIEKAGVQVSGLELWNLEQGENANPYIQQYIQSRMGGEYSREKFMEYRKFISSDQSGAAAEKENWEIFEKQILDNQLQQKYIDLLNKGMYVTKLQAEQENQNQSKQITFKYVLKRYSSVPDSDVTIDESDLEQAYEKNKEQYKQKTARNIEYVSFDVLPSAEDTADLLSWFKDLKADFEKTEDAKRFVNGESDTRFNDVFVKKDAVSENLVSLFNAEEGTVTDVYLEGNSYKMAKLVELANLADSVKVRHILVNSKGTAQANKTFADSILDLAQSGSDFSELAKANSDDKSSGEKGGDLDWIQVGTMSSLKSFEDSIFNTPKGEIKLVASQAGYHIYEVLAIGEKSTKAKIAIVDKEITPGDVTYDKAYNLASAFAATALTEEGFDKAVQEQNLAKRIADNLEATQSEIPGIANARDLVKWAYKASKGDVSSVEEFENKFVVAKLSKITEEGYASIEDRKFELEIEAKKAKKAAVLVQKLKDANASDLNALGTAVGEPVQEVTNTNFGAYSINGLGRENDLIGAVFALPLNQLSAPIVGEQGVFVVEVVNVTEASELAVEITKNTLTQSYSRRGTYEGINAIKDAAEVEDNRATVF